MSPSKRIPTFLVNNVNVILKKGGSFTVAVVDAAEDATATRLLAPRCAASAGVLTYATGGGSAELCTFEDGALVDVVPPGRLLGDVRRGALSALLDRLRREYNFVLVDLPGAGFTHPFVRETVEAATATSSCLRRSRHRWWGRGLGLSLGSPTSWC